MSVTMRSALLIALTACGVLRAQEGFLSLPLDAQDSSWTEALPIADGISGGAARFAAPGARINAGRLRVDPSAPFTLRAAIRTKSGRFATPFMAREGDSVALSLVMGRTPGCISFEAWSWQGVKLVSRRRVDDGAWHRIEVAYQPEGRIAALFLDGQLEVSGELGEASAREVAVRLGNNIGAHQPFEGDLDELSLEPRRSHEQAYLLASLKPLLAMGTRRSALSRVRGALLGGPGEAAFEVPSTTEAWKARSDAIRAGIQDAIGLAPWPPRPESAFQVHGEKKLEGCVVQRVSWISWPDQRATGWLWLPDPKPAGRLPVALHPHGHWENGAMNPVVQARCRRFAEAGYVSLAIDSVHVEDVASGVCSVGAMTWNAMRAIDWLVAREDVDPERIAVTGASGGAQQTMYLMVLEPRLAAAAPICMISRFREILAVESAHCGCNHAPRVAAIADEPELCATFAPKPALYGSVTGDWTKNFPEQGLPEIRAVYELLGAPDAVAHRHLEAGHNYDRPFREAVYEFFDRVLGAGPGTSKETARAPVPLAELRAMGPPPAQLDAKKLAAEHRGRRPKFERWQEAAPALAVSRDRRKRSRPISDDLGPHEHRAYWPWMIALSEPPALTEVPIPLMEAWPSASGLGPIVIAPEGRVALAAHHAAWFKGKGIVLPDIRFTGEWSPFAAAWRRNGLLLGCGEGYLAARDLADVVDALRSDKPVRVVAYGSTGVTALLAATLSPHIGVVIAPDLGPLYKDDGNRLPLCPELLRLGDLPDIVKSLAPRRVVLGGVPDPKAYAGLGDSVFVQSAPLDDAVIARELTK